MKKRVLLFSCDPGGANTIIPLSIALKKHFKVMVFGKDASLNVYLKNKINAENICNHLPSINESSITEFLRKLMPDLIITGTSNDFSERIMWKSAKELGVPSFAIVDQWVNYGFRFSNFTANEINLYNQNKVHPYLPTKILVMDSFAKEEMVKDGIPSDLIEITGQPYFEELLNTQKKNNLPLVEKFKSQFNATNNLVITFASEPISVTYHENDDSEHYWGFTERTIFREFLNVLNKVVDENMLHISLFIKPHPKEPDNNLNDLLIKCSPNVFPAVVKNADPWTLILSSDLVCGIGSMFLIESVILQKPVISILIGLSRENPFILDRRNILKSIKSREDLEKKILDILILKEQKKYDFEVISNPVDNIIKLSLSWLN